MTGKNPVFKLEHFPITLLPSVMGLVGLAIAYLKFQHFYEISAPIGQILLLASSGYFALLMLTYAVKLANHSESFLKDWRHPSG